jgi:hypothetical protein
MNTLGSRDIRIVGSNSQADRVMLEWMPSRARSSASTGFRRRNTI